MCLIACTGYGSDDDVRLMTEAGFDGHLIKPVGVADLERILLD
jgi:CheY-like chemotaxis protein